MGKSRIRDRKLADAFSGLETDVRNIRRLASLSHGLFHELPPEFDGESQEEYAALLWAIEALTVDIERRWDESWEKARSDANVT